MVETKNSIQIVDEFQALILKKSNWDHKAHLIVGLWFLCKHRNNVNEAYCRLRVGIILLNRKHDTKNTIDSGFHTTITYFWLLQMSAFLESRDTSEHGESEFNTHADALLKESGILEPGYIEKFYNKQVLMSPKARAIYLKPKV